MVDVTGAEIQVPPHLGDLPLQIRATCAKVEDELSKLNSNLVALQAFWQGQGADGHHSTHQEWQKAETNLLTNVGALGDLAGTAQVNWGNYVDGESAVVQSWAH
jgi:uncharacterized protein YukE